MTDNSKNIAGRIKLFRRLRGMSQKDLSRESDINLSMIKKYEIGTRIPKIDRLEVIANALGISLYSLVDLNVGSINDIIFIVLQMDEQTKLKMTGKKDKDGHYIPESVGISFDDPAINQALADYMDINEAEKKNGGSLTVDFDAKIDDINILIEDQKMQLFLNNDEVQRP